MAGSSAFPVPFSSVSLSGHTTLSTADHRCAYVMQIEEAGNIDAVIFGARTVSTGVPITVRIEGVTTAGNPDGSLIHANATGTMGGNVAANSINIVTLTAAVAVTRNQEVAAVLLPSTTPVNAAISSIANLAPGGGFPYSLNSTTAGASWGKVTSSAPIIGLRYDDGTYVWSGQPIALVSAFTNRAISTSTGASTGTRRGIRFRMEADFTLEGVWAFMTIGGATSDGAFELYSDAGSLIATLVTVEAGQAGSAGAIVYTWRADTAQSLTASTWYRLVFTPSSTNSVTLVEAVSGAAGMFRAMHGDGIEAQETAYVSAAWVDTATSCTLMGVVGTVQSAPGGGGGGTYTAAPRLIGGGLVG
jgi:hypothetical protein